MFISSFLNITGYFECEWFCQLNQNAIVHMISILRTKERNQKNSQSLHFGLMYKLGITLTQNNLYRATIGVDFALKVINHDQNTIIRLQLWDIAGQVSL